MPRIPPQQVLLKLRKVSRENPNPENPDYYVLLVAARYLRPKFDGKVHMLCNIERRIPFMMEFGGTSRSAHIILKVFVKIPRQAIETERKRHEYERLVKGKLTFTS